MVGNALKDLDFNTFQVNFDVISFLLIDMMNSFYTGKLSSEEARCYLRKYHCLACDLSPGNDLEKLLKISVFNVIERFFDDEDLLPDYACILVEDIDSLPVIDLINLREYPILSSANN